VDLIATLRLRNGKLGGVTVTTKDGCLLAQSAGRTTKVGSRLDVLDLVATGARFELPLLIVAGGGDDYFPTGGIFILANEVTVSEPEILAPDADGVIVWGERALVSATLTTTFRIG